MFPNARENGESKVGLRLVFRNLVLVLKATWGRLRGAMMGSASIDFMKQEGELWACRVWVEVEECWPGR